jgi:hypothetical protein
VEEFFIAIIVAALFYGVLRLFKISWLKQSFPPSFIYIAGIFAWCAGLALLATVFSLFSVLLDLVTAFDSDTLVILIVVFAVLGIGAKFVTDKKEILDIDHMIPFLRAAITFKPYDARRQELFERHEKMQLAEARRAAAERVASGKPAEEAIDISEDKSSDSGTVAETEESPVSNSELDLLKRGEGTDISEIFKSNTAKQPAHPLYEYISQLRIDPADKVMKFRMVFTMFPGKTELTPDKLQRVKQGTYQVFQTLMTEEWLKPYTEFFNTIKTTCVRVQKDDFDMPKENSFMTIQMSVSQLRQNRGKPFNTAEFGKIAVITVEGPS